MKRLALPLILAAFALIQGTASASTDEAVKRMHAAVDAVISTAQHSADRAALQANVKPVLETYINFATMTRRAVGPGWRQFTPDQQKEAVGLFTTLIIRTYSSKFTPGELPVIKFLTATEPAPGRVEVPTTSSYEGNHYSVTYRVEQADGWRITDVVIEGVSLIADYRSQFDSEFQKGGASAVLAALNRSVATSK